MWQREAKSCYHPFFSRKAWAPQSKVMWKSARKVCGRGLPGPPPPERATPTVVTPLRKTKVGGVITLAPPEEEEVEEVMGREEDGPSLPAP